MPKLSENIYSLPLEANLVEYVVMSSPGHYGPYEGAIDFTVPVGTEVLAPLDGEVIKIIQDQTEYGPSKAFAKKANFVELAHKGGEISELIHLDTGSVIVKIGDNVQRGQIIGRTGLSGWMTAPHLHWGVYRKIEEKPGFEMLAISIDEAASALISMAK